jgi:hypothetical protein
MPKYDGGFSLRVEDHISAQRRLATFELTDAGHVEAALRNALGGGTGILRDLAAMKLFG